MTLYQLIKELSAILTPEDDAFYDYVLHTSDDNGGFLRTRYCWWEDRPVQDRELGDGFETVLVTAKRPIDTAALHDRSETRVKLQITYSERQADEAEADWDAQLGYCYVYLFDLKKRMYSMRYLENPCK